MRGQRAPSYYLPPVLMTLAGYQMSPTLIPGLEGSPPLIHRRVRSPRTRGSPAMCHGGELSPSRRRGAISCV